MTALVALTRLLGKNGVANLCIAKTPNVFTQQSLVSLLLVSHNSSSQHRGDQFQSRRTLILESTSSKSVTINRLSHSDSGIIEVNLDRPERKNAIGRDMLKELQHSFEIIHKDNSARVVMICSSVPRIFCAGADLKKLRGCLNVYVSIEEGIVDLLRDLKERKTMTPSEVHTFVNTLRYVFSFIEALHIPTIAVIEGAALGGGLEMALSCDLRVSGEDAAFSLPETGLAIIPGAGGTQRLPRLVGKSIAKELIFTGRKLSGLEAVSIGLVNYCVPAGGARSKALDIAREINDKGPLAVKLAKKAINEGFETNMASALEMEEYCYQQLLNTNDRLEGLAAFAEKRKPIYNGE